MRDFSDHVKNHIHSFIDFWYVFPVHTCIAFIFIFIDHILWLFNSLLLGLASVKLTRLLLEIKPEIARETDLHNINSVLYMFLVTSVF
jgi:hypothetical protein